MSSTPEKNKNNVLNIRIIDTKHERKPNISETRIGKSENGVSDISKKLKITPKPKG